MADRDMLRIDSENISKILMLSEGSVYEDTSGDIGPVRHSWFPYTRTSRPRRSEKASLKVMKRQ
jgi:hypothetical protein